MSSADELYGRIRNCRLCSNVVHGKIVERGEDGTVLFVAIQPSWKGHPDNPKRRKDGDLYFDNFWRLKEQCGLGRCRFTNFVKCATDTAKELPDLLEINNCLPWLNSEVKDFRTKYVVVVSWTWYYFWKDYIEKTLNIKSNWCYHYARRSAIQEDYLVKQTKRLEAIRSDLENLDILPKHLS